MCLETAKTQKSNERGRKNNKDRKATCLKLCSTHLSQHLPYRPCDTLVLARPRPSAALQEVSAPKAAQLFPGKGVLCPLGNKTSFKEKSLWVLGWVVFFCLFFFGSHIFQTDFLETSVKWKKEEWHILVPTIRASKLCFNTWQPSLLNNHLV